MRRFITPLLIIGFLLGGAWYYYYHTLPNTITDKILNKDLQVKLTVEKQKALGVKDEKRVPVDELIQLSLRENNVTIGELIQWVENIEPGQVESFMDECAKMNLDSVDLSFEQVTSYFDFDDFPIDSFQTEYEVLYDEKKLEQALSLYEKNKEQLPLILPMLKKTAIRYLKKIESDSVTINVE